MLADRASDQIWISDRLSASPLARKNSSKTSSMSTGDTDAAPSSSRDADIETQTLLDRRNSKSMRAAKAVVQAPKEVICLANSCFLVVPLLVLNRRHNRLLHQQPSGPLSGAPAQISSARGSWCLITRLTYAELRCHTVQQQQLHRVPLPLSGRQAPVGCKQRA